MPTAENVLRSVLAASGLSAATSRDAEPPVTGYTTREQAGCFADAVGLGFEPHRKGSQRSGS